MEWIIIGFGVFIGFTIRFYFWIRNYVDSGQFEIDQRLSQLKRK